MIYTDIFLIGTGEVPFTGWIGGIPASVQQMAVAFSDTFKCEIRVILNLPQSLRVNGLLFPRTREDPLTGLIYRIRTSVQGMAVTLTDAFECKIRIVLNGIHSLCVDLSLLRGAREDPLAGLVHRILTAIGRVTLADLLLFLL